MSFYWLPFENLLLGNNVHVGFRNVRKLYFKKCIYLPKPNILKQKFFVILVSLYFEGLSLSWVHNAHLFEPWSCMASLTPANPWAGLMTTRMPHKTPWSAGADLTHEVWGGASGEERRGGEENKVGLPAGSQNGSKASPVLPLCLCVEVSISTCVVIKRFASLCVWQPSEGPSPLIYRAARFLKGAGQHKRVSGASHVGRLIGNQIPQVCEVPPRMTETRGLKVCC